MNGLQAQKASANWLG